MEQTNEIPIAIHYAPKHVQESYGALGARVRLALGRFSLYKMPIYNNFT